MSISDLHSIFLKCSGVSTDTRNILQDNLFFALKGENFNGNLFAEKAIEAGAAYAIVDESDYAKSEKTILVNDVLTALQELARYHRNYLGLPIISLTGSNGKTTTKELINTVLSQSFKTVATKGNLNNHIGVPLTLLSMDESTQMGIVEMGANHIGEIKMLAEIAQPDYGYITNFGKAHLEGFGGVEGVIKGKSELYDYLRRTDGLIFLNGDDAKQVEKAQKTAVYSFGESQKNNIKITYPPANPFAAVNAGETKIQSNLIGQYNATNIAAAVCIGQYFNVEIGKINAAIENYTPTNNRSQIIKNQGQTIILDAYNANPTSMEAAIKNFAQLEAETKILFLGDMFELGAEASAEHEKIAQLATSYTFDKVIFLGENFQKSETAQKNTNFKNFDQLKELGLAEEITQKLPAAHILIKGSRGMALERLLDII